MEKSTLKESVTIVEAMAIVMGMIVSSGILLKPGIVLGDADNLIISVAAWIAGGIITLASALSVAEITSAIPKSDRFYTCPEELYDERAGSLLDWVQTMVSYPAPVMTQAIAFSIYAVYFIPISDIQQKLLVTGVLIFILVINILSTRYGGITQTLAMVGKLIPVVTIIGVGLLSPNLPGSTGSSQEALQDTGFDATILGILWVYDGWISVANMAGELKNPPKILPRVISIGMLFVIMIYALFNLAIFHALLLDQIVASAMPSADATGVLFGEGGATFVTAGIMVSVFSALNGYLMTAARVPQAIGERGQLPFSRILGVVHPKLRTPANALILQSLLALVYIFSGTFNILTSLLVFVLRIFFTMGVLDVFVLRKGQRPKEGKYRVPLYPITPIIGAVGGVYISINTLIDTPFRSIIGFTVAPLGLPVYQWTKKRKEQ